MPDITLGDMLTLLFTDLASTVDQTDSTAGIRLQVTHLDLDIPTYLRLSEPGTEPGQESRRLVLALPSSRESPMAGRVGRISLTLGVETSPPSQTQPAPTPLEKP